MNELVSSMELRNNTETELSMDCAHRQSWSGERKRQRYLEESEDTGFIHDALVDGPPPKRVANQRERTRTASVNDAFVMLRQLIPTEPINRKLSKIETLRLASSYISHLHSVLVTGFTPAEQPCLRHQQMTPPDCVPGRCPVDVINRVHPYHPHQHTAGKEKHRTVCTFCVTEMKQHQRALSETNVGDLN